MKKRKDYTGKFCDLHPSTGREWPMYSYERPAWDFWNGFANGLKDQGFSEAEIEEWLKSKLARWLLDQNGHKLYDLGYELSQGSEQVE